MDPHEIAQNDEDDFEPLSQVLRLIANKGVPIEDIKGAASRFSKTIYDNQDDVALNAIGCTYW